MYRPIGLIVPNRVPQCPAIGGNCYPGYNNKLLPPELYKVGICFQIHIK